MSEHTHNNTESSFQRLRNYLLEKREDIYHEQTPGTQRRVDNVNTRLSRLNKRFNPVKKEHVPQGREIIRRALIGGATGVAEMLDGKHAVKRRSPKRKPRKSRVVK